MKDTLKPGLAHTFKFTVDETKTVPHLYPEAGEFAVMPNVFATGFMIGLIEWTCIQAVNPHIDWPREQTVGTHVDMSHVAATPPGMVVTVDVRLIEVDGRRLVFEVEARDEADLIGSGKHERFVILKDKFDQKLKSKHAGPAGNGNF